MDRHEILKKARASKKDEREEQLENKSYKFSWFGVTFILVILMVFRFYQNQSATELVLIVLAQITFRAFYQFLKVKDTYHTLSFILTLGGFIAVGILFLVEHELIG